MGGLVTAIFAWWQGLSYLGVAIVAISVGTIITIGIAVVFQSLTSGNIPSFERRRLNRIPKLANDIHKRISKVREHLVKKTDWDSLDISEIIAPLMEVLADDSNGKPSVPVAGMEDYAIPIIKERMGEAGRAMRGAPSVLDTVLQRVESISLEKKLHRDFWYRVLLARIEQYEPYPNDIIRSGVQTILSSSLSANNVIIFQHLAPDGLFDMLRNLTSMSATKRMEIYVADENAEKIINDAIKAECTKLYEHIEDYVYKRAGKK